MQGFTRVLMKKYLIYTFLLISIQACFNNGDSWKDPSIRENILTKRIDSLNSLSFKYLRRDLVKSIQFSKQTDSLSRRYYYQKGLARSLRSQAYYHYYSDQSLTALQLLQESEKIEKEIHNIKGLAATYNTKAFVLRKNNFNEDALKLYKKVISFEDSTITKKSRITSYNNIANIYNNTYQYDSAVVYYNRLLRDFVDIEKDSNLIAIVYTNIANTQSLLKNYSLAKKNYKKALSYCINKKNEQKAKIYNNLGSLDYEYQNYDMALKFYHKSIIGKSNNIRDKLSLGSTYRNIANVYIQKKIYQKADSYLDLAKRIFYEHKDYENLAKVCLTKAEKSKRKGNYSQSKKELEKANEFIDLTDRIDLKKQSLKMMAEILNDIGEYKSAYKKYEEYQRLNDSLLNADTFWRVAELEKKHQLQIKQKEIALVEKDRDLSEVKVLQKETENKRLLATILLIVIITILLILLVFYLYKLRKSSLQNSKQKEALLHQKIQNLANDQEIKIMNATLEGRSKEKKVISKELHDNVGSLLTAINFHLNAFHLSLFQSSPKMLGLYKKLLGITENVIDEVRHISHRLDNESTLRFNLKNAINDFCTKVENDQLKIETSVKGVTSFNNTEVSVFIFRILQELVNNTMKHAQANLLKLTLNREKEYIRIHLRDNGKGISDEDEKGIGLKNLKKEVIEKKGEFSIETFQDQGTSVYITIPA